MPTAITIDETVHLAHEDTDQETFCGESYSRNTISDQISMLTDVEFLVAYTLDHTESTERCKSCIKNGEEWATPD
jgi:hypothetical protein